MTTKYTIRISDSGTTAGHINIPIELGFQMVDQSEIIQRKFVDVEVENAINPILDYERVRFVPAITAITNNTLVVSKIRNIVYDVRFSGTTGFPSVPSSYADIGITNDDIRFGRNRFKRSFLRLNFYDNDKASDQR